MDLKNLEELIALSVKSVTFLEFIDKSRDYKFPQFYVRRKISRPLSQTDVSCKSNFFKLFIYSLWAKYINPYEDTSELPYNINCYNFIMLGHLLKASNPSLVIELSAKLSYFKFFNP